MAVTQPGDSNEGSLQWWHSLVCYGASLLVVAISAVVDPFSFGTFDYCWLRADNYFVFSLIGPALLLIGLEIAFLAVAMIRTCQFHLDDDLKAKEMAKLASAK